LKETFNGLQKSNKIFNPATWHSPAPAGGAPLGWINEQLSLPGDFAVHIRRWYRQINFFVIDHFDTNA
jgi:hypothetical protein